MNKLFPNWVLSLISHQTSPHRSEICLTLHTAALWLAIKQIFFALYINAFVSHINNRETQRAGGKLATFSEEIEIDR